MHSNKDLGGHDSQAERALELYERLGCEDDQFTVRSLLVRCLCEARLGEQHRLKGHHLLQQLQYALKQYLMKALAKANETGWAQNDSRYGFLIYNASLVFWAVARPMCRNGWQRHIINEATQILDGLRAARAAAGGAAGGKPGGKAPGGAAIPVTIDLPWMIELTLNLAFGLEDAGKDADAQKKADEANQLLDELMKESGSDPAVADRNTRLRQLVWNARAYFYRKAPGWGRIHENTLLKAWATIDADFDLRAAVQSFSTDPRAPRPDGGQVVRGNVKPQSLIDLALALRATCVAKQWPLALCMICRLEKFQMPPGRGRILLDLSKAECEVWHASTVKKEDPTSKMLLSAADQEQRESNRLIPLRVQLHFEVAHCEVASDLLTKGYGELQRANTLDYTVTEAELPDTVRPLLNDSDPSAPPLGRDPAHYLRRFDEATEAFLEELV
eukprot:g4962.t1